MKYILSLSILMIAACGASAQELRGRVANTDGPLPGATVQISESEGVVTDTTGAFIFTDLRPGAYELVVRSIGHETIRKNVKVPASGPVEIFLPVNSLGLQEVVVTGSMAPVYLKDSPVKIEVIRSDHIETFLPSASTGIVETLSLINGVQEVISCGVCFTNSISINGLPGPYTAVLMDGTPMYGNLASVYGLNGIPSSIIDRIEVIKGPNSTLYGSEAVAGVINIITRDPADQPRLTMDVMGTSNRELFSNLALRMDAGKSRGILGINHAWINLFEDDNGDGFSDIVNVDRVSVFSKWNLHRDSGKKWTIAGKYYYEDRRNGVEEYLQDRAYQDLRGDDEVYGESILTHRAELFGTYTADFLPDLRVDYSFSFHDQDSYYGAAAYQARQQISFANIIWSPEIGNHRILTGLTSRYQYYDDNTIATPEADRQFIPGVFLQDEWDISRTFSLLSGARLDHYSRHGWIASPRLNLKARTGKYTTFRANFGTGFRLVNLFTEDHAFVTGQREVVIGEALEPERSYNGSLNFNHLFTPGESQGSIDIDLFYTYFTNKIIPDYSDPELIVYENSGGHAITRGAGITWSHEFLFPLSFTAGFTVQRATENEENEDGETSTRRIEFAPDFTGTFALSYRLKKAGLQLAWSSQFTGPMRLPEVYDLDNNGEPLPYSRPTTSGTFAIHSLQVTRKFNRSFTVYGGVQNIFNFMQSYSPLTGYNDPGTSPGFSDHFDTAYSFAPIHGREFYLGLKWTLDK